MFEINGDLLINIMAFVFLPICIYSAWKTIKAGNVWLGLAISSTVVLVDYVTLLFVDSSVFSYNTQVVYSLVIYNIGGIGLCYFSSLSVWCLMLAIKSTLKFISSFNNLIKPGNTQLEVRLIKK